MTKKQVIKIDEDTVEVDGTKYKRVESEGYYGVTVKPSLEPYCWVSKSRVTEDVLYEDSSVIVTIKGNYTYIYFKDADRPINEY